MVHRLLTQHGTSVILTLLFVLGLVLVSCHGVNDTAPAEQMTIYVPPWTPVDEGVMTTSGITLAWHDVIWNDRYTAVVYSLSSDDKGMNDSLLKPLRTTLRVSDSMTMNPVADVAVGSWKGVDMRVAVFGPRPPGSEFVEVDLAGVQHGQRIIDGNWRLRLLNIDVANDDLSARGFHQPYPGILELNGAVVRTLAGGWLQVDTEGEVPEETPFQNSGTPTPVPVAHDFSEVATVQFVNAARGLEQDWMFGFSADGQVSFDSRTGSISASGIKLLQSATPAPAPSDDEGMIVWQTVTLSEATERSSMSILVRPEGPDAQLLEMVRFAPLSTPGRSVVHLHYADGVDTMQWPAQGSGDQVPGGQSLGVIKSEAVDLDGVAAFGFGAGSAVDDRTGEAISYAGQLQWEADGSHHIIYADQTLEGLIAIAKSLRPDAVD